MYFPTADVEVAIWVPPVVAFVISFFTSMGGVSGAFLLLPFQMSFLGYTNPSVSATNQLFNIVAIPSGVYRYCREGRMVWPLTWVVVAGTLPGVFIGAFVRIAYLPDPKAFKLFAGGVLLWIGLKMALDLLKKKGGAEKAAAEKRFQELVRHHEKASTQGKSTDQLFTPAVKVTHFNLSRLGYTFYGEQFDVSFWGIFVLSLMVGVVGGVYGI
ncbi:MAG: sulfite exporter TauE/SafE family protein, partial [Deltaproteobacteria bacterium]|nr:sulfite exporter TauE/SafE family protein [Deltaproteobacteria bacterium]